jgi:gas vesicle protein
MTEQRGIGISDILFSFLIGGAIGAGIVLLSTPQSGKELRKKILDLKTDIGEKGKGYISGLGGHVHAHIEKGKGLFSDGKSVLASAIEAGKEAYELETERLLQSDEEV